MMHYRKNLNYKNFSDCKNRQNALLKNKQIFMQIKQRVKMPKNAKNLIYKNLSTPKNTVLADNLNNLSRKTNIRNNKLNDLLFSEKYCSAVLINAGEI